nr:MAG TPA: hypothetical protein [Microviridae sp.]
MYFRLICLIFASAKYKYCIYVLLHSPEWCGVSPHP